MPVLSGVVLGGPVVTVGVAVRVAVLVFAAEVGVRVVLGVEVTV